MTAIGGKIKLKKPTQPQYVVQMSEQTNDYALLKADERGNMLISWVGDPNAATKFDSKYQAKARVRELVDIPDTRCFKQLD